MKSNVLADVRGKRFRTWVFILQIFLKFWLLAQVLNPGLVKKKKNPENVHRIGKPFPANSILAYSSDACKLDLN